MKFIDLFAGLGGFHIALTKLGHDCVFACEIDEELRNIYSDNFGIRPEGDIRKINLKSIPKHDILCAGFPCQPFSKAGFQKGFNCPDYGDLFEYVYKIIKFHNPKFVFLENVPNIVKHNNGKTWKTIVDKLENIGYNINHNVLSPHFYGIPQIRERVYIICTKKYIPSFSWPGHKKTKDLSIKSILDTDPQNYKPLSKNKIQCINAWQILLDKLPKDIEIISPMWAMEFGANYPFEEYTPSKIGFSKLKNFKGSFGKSLKTVNENNISSLIPTYALTKEDKFPKWKIEFIKRNREFYKQNKSVIDHWLHLIKEFPPSFQKFEWNCKGEKRIIWNNLIQFRASGVRVKRPVTSPALISMTTQQLPIIGWQKRHMTFEECLKLQSLNKLKYLPESNTGKFRAVGNAVNANIVEIIAKSVFSQI
ncbi:putative modification methylase HhaI [Leptospira broomii serovar Hurstbridge str. 5399]|uniref:Cytosine-specific methyltransferase n=1 Tax=Leptospira broomii serovar Hurstbridge str. 5399 TaxID=1049789 RepID=T0F580_9LEPT|nr:DNA (cytosine-5-)-methyltransferase [Leptospira broomii]EQA46275.1 putative modification methylase HhaI [Leptospira broomii serovar Hurstbridge str. 5399]